MPRRVADNYNHMHSARTATSIPFPSKTGAMQRCRATSQWHCIFNMRTASGVGVAHYFNFLNVGVISYGQLFDRFFSRHYQAYMMQHSWLSGDSSSECSAQGQVHHCRGRNLICSFTRDRIGVVASRCFLHPTLSLASEQT